MDHEHVHFNVLMFCGYAPVHPSGCPLPPWIYRGRYYAGATRGRQIPGTYQVGTRPTVLSLSSAFGSCCPDFSYILTSFSYILPLYPLIASLQSSVSPRAPISALTRLTASPCTPLRISLRACILSLPGYLPPTGGLPPGPWNFTCNSYIYPIHTGHHRPPQADAVCLTIQEPINPKTCLACCHSPTAIGY